MKKFASFAVALAISSCAGTTLYDPVTGKKLAEIGGDAEKFSLNKTADGAVSVSIEGLSASKVIRATGAAVRNQAVLLP